MKILLTNFFKQIDSDITVYYDHFYRWLAVNLPKDKADVKFLLYEKQYKENQELKLINNYSMKSLTEIDINYIFQQDLTYEQIYEKIHFGNFEKDEQKRLKNVFIDKFGEWIPDIIVIQGFYSTELIWKDIFPQALCLSQENGIFSRYPFYRTLCYEPYNTIFNSFFNKYKENIEFFSINSKENKSIKNFKKSFTKLIDNISPIKEELKYYKRKFKKIILLPLIWTGAEVIKKECFYNTEFDFIKFVLSKISKNTALCITIHPSQSAILKEDIKYLQDKYPNFIYLSKTDNADCCNSLFYFKYIDAVLNFTSKTGLMALFWDKPVLSLTKTYNDWFKDGQGIEELEKVLKQPKKNKNNILYWYLTHYILFEKDFYKKDFLYNYLKEKLEKYRKDGITFEFFNKVNDIEDISEYTINTIKQYYYSKSILKQIVEYLKNVYEKIKNKIIKIKTLALALKNILIFMIKVF